MTASPIKELDRELQSYFARFTRSLEKKGHDKLKIARKVHNSSFLSVLGSVAVTANSFDYTSQDMAFLPPLAMISGVDKACLNITQYTSIQREMSKHPVTYFFDDVMGPYMRPSLILSGLGLIAVGGFEFYKGEYALGIKRALEGYALTGLASSMYIRNSDPKHAERKPFWERAYERCVEGVKGMMPAPEPVPQPVEYTK